MSKQTAIDQILDDFYDDVFIEALPKAKKQLYDLCVAEAKTFSEVTYDFGTAREVGRVQAIPLEALAKIFGVDQAEQNLRGEG